MPGNKVECPQQLNITMIESFKHSLQSALDQGGVCTVDASAVERIDSTGLQLLIAFEQAIQKQGGELKISDPSEVFQTTANTLGLNHLLIDSK